MRLLLAVALILVLGNLTQGSDVEYIGVDAPGGDLQAIQAVSSMSCATACDGNSACSFWVWSYPGQGCPTNTNTCWLKNSDSGRRFVSPCRMIGFKGVQPGTAVPPEPCTGVCTNVQDTALFKLNGTYWRYTHPIGPNGQDILGIQTASSNSLGGPWVSKGPVFGGKWPTDGLPSYGIIKCWTPDIHLLSNGQFLLYYTVFAIYNDSNSNTWYVSQMGSATSNSLAPQSWVDQGAMGIPENYPTYNRIDPNLLIDGDDYYMVWGSYGHGLFGVKMANPPLHAAPGAVITELITDIPFALDNEHPNRTEGPFQFKYGGYYYLFYSNGDCCPGYPSVAKDEYRIQVCRASAPLGPFNNNLDQPCLKYPGLTLMASHDDVYAPGAPSVLVDDARGLIFYYQYMNSSIAYGEPNIRFGWNYMIFDQTGWPQLIR